MLSQKVKHNISEAVQNILKLVSDEELPSGEINFILHIDGATDQSWANIRNSSERGVPVPDILIQNLTTEREKKK